MLALLLQPIPSLGLPWIACIKCRAKVASAHVTAFARSGLHVCDRERPAYDWPLLAKRLTSNSSLNARSPSTSGLSLACKACLCVRLCIHLVDPGLLAWMIGLHPTLSTGVVTAGNALSTRRSGIERLASLFVPPGIPHSAHALLPRLPSASNQRAPVILPPVLSSVRTGE
jgi:hypothetical protein